MAEVNLDHLERLLASYLSCKDMGDYTPEYYARKELQSALRNAAPALLAEVRQLRDANQRLRESLREMLNQYADEGFELGWVKRLHDAARAALAGEITQDVPHV